MMFFFQKIVAITSPEDSYLFRQMFLFSFEMLFLISALATFSVTRLDYFWKILATNIPQLFGNFLGLFVKNGTLL